MTVDEGSCFSAEKECTYDGERYSVRDNGAVLRHPRQGQRPRSLDAKWTFGKPNDKTGYMEIASVRVHRIVATAFHGDPPTPEHVIDHIDTNRRNNRPENLRWLTRLENVLKNPITVRRIELACGSIEAFLADPSILGQSDFDPNFKWMRTVTKQEAEACRARMHLWAKSGQIPSGGSLGEWVFRPLPDQRQITEEHEPELVMSKTPGAAQRNWRTVSEFPCCPLGCEKEQIATYAARLEPGAVFARNELSESVLVAAALSGDSTSLWVMCAHGESALKPWSLAQITFENDLFVHTSYGAFFEKQGAEKKFCLAQGLEWTGGDSIDDYS